MSNLIISPRVIRLRDAPTYLGMKKDHFNQNVRPLLPPIAIGARGIGFDRLDLDAWIEHHKPDDNRSILNLGDNIWDKKECQASSNGVSYGTLTNVSLENEFVRAVERATSLKRKNT
jgi:predicted DNA-binding transcriptional regulator AlpA